VKKRAIHPSFGVQWVYSPLHVLKVNPSVSQLYPPVLLAHGALGIWDEVIFIGVAAAFVVIMAISWLRSRSAAPDDTPPISEAAAEKHDAPNRFTLE
jgi:hypothetical protein